MGEGSFRSSLYLSPKVLEVSPVYSSSQERSPQGNKYMAQLLLTIGSLTKIPNSLVGKSPHHINSIQDFVEQVKHITLAPGECLSSHDVSALFT